MWWLPPLRNFNYISSFRCVKGPNAHIHSKEAMLHGERSRKQAGIGECVLDMILPLNHKAQDQCGGLASKDGHHALAAANLRQNL